jgi:hypothetical protein
MTRRKKPRFNVVTKDKGVWKDATWKVWRGELVRKRGRPPSEQSLFKLVAEKLPFESLKTIETSMKALGIKRTGVYIAHDSMGTARYVGRGSIFTRLRARWKAEPLVLRYFSFYVVLNASHEREVETLLIRAAGPLLEFNDRKKRVTISSGNVSDFEAGTKYFKRHRVPQKKAPQKRGRKRKPV